MFWDVTLVNSVSTLSSAVAVQPVRVTLGWVILNKQEGANGGRRLTLCVLSKVPQLLSALIELAVFA